MTYNLDLANYELLCSYIDDEKILHKIKNSEVIDYTIAKMGFTTSAQVSFKLSSDDKITLKELFSERMMDGFPNSSDEEQSEESQIYESLMYLLIQLKEQKY